MKFTGVTDFGSADVTFQCVVLSTKPTNEVFSILFLGLSLRFDEHLTRTVRVGMDRVLRAPGNPTWLAGARCPVRPDPRTPVLTPPQPLSSPKAHPGACLLSRVELCDPLHAPVKKR